MPFSSSWPSIPSYSLSSKEVPFDLKLGYTGLCKKAGNLKVYLIAQPILIVLELIISITNAFGFNGFIRVHHLFHDSMHLAGVLAIVVSMIFLLTALFSGFIFVRIFREREQLVSDI